MARCRFERTLPNLEEALRRAKAEAQARGSTFEGDVAGGRYVLKTPLGQIEGTYTSSGATVVFVIESKPLLVPCALIEEVLDKTLAKV